MCIFRRLYIIGMIILGFFYGWDVPLNWLSYLIQNNLLKPTSSRKRTCCIRYQITEYISNTYTNDQKYYTAFHKKGIRNLQDIKVNSYFMSVHKTRDRQNPKGGGAKIEISPLQFASDVEHSSKILVNRH